MNLIAAEKFVNECLDKDWAPACGGTPMCLRDRGWKFKGFDRATKRGGICYGGHQKMIGLSTLLTESRSEEEVKNTILHECAHAIDYTTRGTSDHSSIWKSIAQKIGCNGERCFHLDEETKLTVYKYIAVCPVHGVIGGWSRKPKAGARSCKTCHSIIEIKPN